MKKTLLVIDDDQIFRDLLVRQLRNMGFAARGAGTWREARQVLDETEPDALILDYRLPDSDATTILGELHGQYPAIVLTGFGSIQNAVKMIRQGATDYLTKPVDLDALELTVRRVLENAELRRNNAFYRTQLASHQPGTLIGDSSAMRELQAWIEAVAPTEATVLILGESGTGKEMVARAIHRRSARAKREIVTLDSCGIPENLFESELFGHERGAFTGAGQQKKGLIEQAGGGTLFLDEIGDISAAIQAKLLRVMEDGTFRRVGGARTLAADTRIVTATNRNLEEMSRTGTFRSDLFFRISRFVINVPPLRERREDIPALSRHFLAMHARAEPLDLVPAALDLLLNHDWPGNVRELKNAIERAVILSRGSSSIRPEHLSFIHRAEAPPANDAAITLRFAREPRFEDIEKEYLRLIMEKYAGNRQKSAAVLGISERNIYRLIEKYGLN